MNSNSDNIFIIHCGFLRNNFILLSPSCQLIFVMFLALSTCSYRRTCASRFYGGLYCTALIAFPSAMSSVDFLSKSFVKNPLSFLFCISVAFSCEVFGVIPQLHVQEFFFIA